MNREILFRGKRLDNSEWVEGGYFQEPYTSKAYIICWNSTGMGYNEFIEVDPSTVGQYTGLKDRNGKRIFEGDVVKYNGTKHEVAFEHMGGTAYFGIRFLDREESWAFGHYADPFLISAIGNIHDNPELIGGNNEQA